MSVAKSWAFVNEYGLERISALDIKSVRDRNGGGSLGKTYWSPHHEGERKRVSHKVNKDGTTFFAYIDGNSGSTEGGGISLSHVLYQEAISKLASTELRLGKNRTHKINITHSQLEKSLKLSGNLYKIDVYCQFDSKDDLASKWGHELYIEVCHTHPIPLHKTEDLKKHRIPVIEVKVSEHYLYRFEEDTSKEREINHVNFLINQLGEFLVGQVKSDPSSVEFLENYSNSLKNKLLESELYEKKQRELIEKLSRDLDESKKELSIIKSHSSNLNDSISKKNVQNESYKKSIQTLKDDLQLLKDKLSARTLALTTISFVLAIDLGFKVYFTFFH